MTPDIVVDVGNTSIKWGRCAGGKVVEVCSLPHRDPDAWRARADAWGLGASTARVVTGVHPEQRDAVAEFARRRGEHVRVLDLATELPLRVRLEKPDHVGIDRLLDAVAANSRRPAGVPAVVIDAGSAVTVDWVDADGAFCGGAIMPGLRLMALALHEHTALLPVIETPKAAPVVPGTATPSAMEVGVYWSVAGGIIAILDAYRRHFDASPFVFLTGGDSKALLETLRQPVTHWPDMTLEGIRLAAEALA
jgi:type III pantothenate kinase